MSNPSPPPPRGTFNFSPTHHPADILITVASVTHFLAECSHAFADSGPHLGISEDGAQGLSYILTAVENTIQAVIERL